MATKIVYPGIKKVFHSDIDPHANKAYDILHEDVEQIGDFTQVMNPKYVDFFICKYTLSRLFNYRKSKRF